MTRVYWLVAFALILLAWVVSAALYPGLPARIPIHWNIHGKIDGYGPKWTVFLMPATMLFLLGLFAVLPALSPRNFEVDSFRSTYLFIMVLVIGLMGYIHGVILYAGALGGRIDMTRALSGGMFLFFALMGNVLGRIKRNFYMGVRVPWTLASERVWNDTHRLAAWVFVAAGLLGFVIVMAGLPVAIAFGLLIVAALVPIVYSFVHYKALERRGAL
jgi:uncharacterized membrane protein